MQDLGVYFNAYWLKVRRDDDSIGLVRLPPEEMTVIGWLVPTAFLWTLPDGRVVPLALDQVVYFNGYDPMNPLMGLSPLETLRQLLAEDAAQTAYRQSYWKNSSRIEGVITRPKDAPKWNLDQKQAFREQWQTRYGGGSGAGATAVLEDGMQFQPVSFSARDSEFVPARKLTREEVAAAYHVPLPMVGILDHATFSNIKEQHKQLYQDCLGPWLQMIAEEIERQLLPDSEDSDRVYLEFNIQEKLKGSFEEQAASLYALVGRPIMTANEGRARLNLPRITDDASADALALPLNTSSGAITLPEPVAAERLLMLEAIIDGVEVEAA
jgi:HK97 family phage portal protein